MAVIQMKRPSKAERTRRAILTAAEAQFAKRGFHAARLDDIGAEVGIAGSAILYHFRGKQELYRSVLDDLVAGLSNEIEDVLSSEPSLIERLEGVIGRSVRYLAARPALAHLALQESGTDDPELRAELQGRAKPFLGLLQGLYEEGARSGVLRPIGSDALHLVSAIAGTVVFYIGALPTFVEDLPSDHLSAQQIDALERDALLIARQLLGIPGPRSPRRKQQEGSA
jgi:AcrR family transcriptional regulator